MSNNKPSIILYPCPGMGHLRPMIELAKFLQHHHSFSVTIVVLQPHYHHGSFAPYLSHAISSNPSISFHTLPPSSISTSTSTSPHRSAQVFQLVQVSNHNLHSFLTTFSQSTPISALIVDFFCTCAIDSVAKKLHIPTHVFFPSPASFLELLLHLPKLHPINFRQMGPTLVTNIPGLPDLPADHMPQPILDGPDDDAYLGFLSTAHDLPNSNGFIVNTFHDFEERAVDAIADGPWPPIYCIGPITSELDDERSSECLLWLDKQPVGSVVFLCFGSMGSFAMEQLTEIAMGLEKSGQRFLWVVRSPVENVLVEPTEAVLEKLLPEGFVERMEGRGLVVKEWAPQAAVLRHVAVGGFVTHCGWNSILEGVSAGVGLIAWPLHAEQKMNKVLLVEEAKVAVAMEKGEEGLVKAEEVEIKVRWLMESDGGREMRERARVMRECGRVAMEEGGSSYKAMTALAIKLTVKNYE